MGESLLQEPTTTAKTETMTAAVVHSFDEPLRIEQVRKPTAGQGEIVVRIEASGLCHTDIHAAHGDWPVKPTPPFVPGHEGVGIVESSGQASREVAVGDRVAIPWLGCACGNAATTASPAGRRSVTTSGTPATRSTAASPSSSARGRYRRQGAGRGSTRLERLRSPARASPPTRR